MESQTVEVQEEILTLHNVLAFGVKEEFALPGQAQKFLDLLLADNDETRALVLDTVPSGTVPDDLVPIIQKYTEKGISIFLVAGNYGTDHGILPKGDLRYGTLRAPVKAGAIPIRDVNVRHISDVAQAVQKAINEGKTGRELNAAIIDKFGTVPEVMPPE